MSNDDETVERVAQAILSRITEIGSEVAGRPIQADEFDEMCASQYARAALSAMPQRELLREALDALTPFEQEAVLWDDLPEPPDEDKKLWIGSWGNRNMTDEARFSLGDLRRARAAADKIRASLTQEPQP